jgi:hypothetical protein
MADARTNYLRLAAVLFALVAVAILLSRKTDDDIQPAIPDSDRQLPITNPPVDPNRPDLLGEPRIDEPDP